MQRCQDIPELEFQLGSTVPTDEANHEIESHINEPHCGSVVDVAKSDVLIGGKSVYEDFEDYLNINTLKREKYSPQLCSE